MKVKFPRISYGSLALEEFKTICLIRIQIKPDFAVFYSKGIDYGSGL